MKKLILGSLIQAVMQTTTKPVQYVLATCIALHTITFCYGEYITHSIKSNGIVQSCRSQLQIKEIELNQYRSAITATSNPTI